MVQQATMAIRHPDDGSTVLSDDFPAWVSMRIKRGDRKLLVVEANRRGVSLSDLARSEPINELLAKLKRKKKRQA